jgi:hypothetical protein
MYRQWISAGLVAATLAPGGERIEAVYREGAVLVFEQEDSLEMEPDGASISINGIEVPAENLELPAMSEEKTLRFEDRVLASSEGRPTRVRRSFEQLHQVSVETGEETEETGPLEGRTLVLEETDGEVLAKLEDDGDVVDELYLRRHRLTTEGDPLLPDREVALGDRWPLAEEELRELVGIDRGPVLFPEDEEEEEGPFEQLLEEAASFSGEVEFEAIEERGDLRCAVLAFTITLESRLDDPAALGIELAEGMEDLSGVLAADIRVTGRLWHALAEARPVALEQKLEGSVEFRMEGKMKAEGQEFLMKTEIEFSLTGEYTGTWSVPE